MRIPFIILFLALFFNGCQQNKKKTKHRIAIDLAHKEVFWHDPADMPGFDPDFIDRMKYMTSEFTKTAASVSADFIYLKKEITPDDLQECDMLFIHFPKAQYTPTEVSTISKFINDGGALFLVMDGDYWSTLAETNVNDLIAPIGIQFGEENPDKKTNGGRTKAGVITKDSLKISYHEARIVNGGTPFAYSLQSEELPFGKFIETKNGSRIIVMGEGMVSLYMTSWEGVNDFQCQEFMQDCFKWLLRE